MPLTRPPLVSSVFTSFSRSPGVVNTPLVETVPATASHDTARAREQPIYFGKTPASRFVEEVRSEAPFPGVAQTGSFFSAGLDGALMLSALLMRAKSSFPKINFKSGSIKDHLWIGAWSSLFTAALYWSLFLYGGALDAKTFEVMLATLPFYLIFGSLLGYVTHEIWTNSVQERFVRSFGARVVNFFKLSKLVPALSENEGLPYYAWMDTTFQMMSLNIGCEIELNRQDVEDKQAELAAGRLTPRQTEVLDRQKQKLSEAIALKEQDQKLLREYSQSLIPRQQRRRKPLNLDLRYLTFFASTALTAGGMVLLNGAPQRTENTDAIIKFVGLLPFVGAVVATNYDKWFGANIWEYVVRPKIAKLEKGVKSIFGLGDKVMLLPGIAGKLILPEIHRNIQTFNRIELSLVFNVTRLHDLKFKLESRKDLSLEDQASLKRYASLIEECEETLSRVTALMKWLEAR